MNWFGRIGVLLVLVNLGLSGCTKRNETVFEKAETGANKAVDAVTSTARDAEDKICEMVNGKLECVAKKVVNKAESVMDKVETKAIETKNKVD